MRSKYWKSVNLFLACCCTFNYFKIRAFATYSDGGVTIIRELTAAIFLIGNFVGIYFKGTAPPSGRCSGLPGYVHEAIEVQCAKVERVEPRANGDQFALFAAWYLPLWPIDCRTSYVHIRKPHQKHEDYRAGCSYLIILSSIPFPLPSSYL